MFHIKNDCVGENWKGKKGKLKDHRGNASGKQLNLQGKEQKEMCSVRHLANFTAGT